MSQENVEVIRSLYETRVTPFDAAPDQIDRIFRDYLDEQFEVRLPPDYPEGRYFGGETALRNSAPCSGQRGANGGSNRSASSTLVTASSCSCAYSLRVGPAVCRLKSRRRTSGRFAALASRPCMRIETVRKPSKPPG